MHRLLSISLMLLLVTLPQLGWGGPSMSHGESYVRSMGGRTLAPNEVTRTQLQRVSIQTGPNYPVQISSRNENGQFSYKVLMTRGEQPIWETFGDYASAKQFAKHVQKTGYYDLMKFFPPNGKPAWQEVIIPAEDDCK